MTNTPNTSRRGDLIAVHRYSVPVVREVVPARTDVRRELHEIQVRRVRASLARIPE